MPNSLKWEQCTGLKDKNGKLNYEGDILKNHRDEIVKVVWLKDNAGFFLEGIKEEYSEWPYGATKDYEVIGNVHENHDLLEGQEK